MSNEKQKTFGAKVGMESVVPTRRHANDIITCADGACLEHSFVHYDCRGGAHSSAEDRHESNVAIVTEILMNEDKWVEEYTQSDDYGANYAECLAGDSDRYNECVEEWIRNEYHDFYGYGQFDDCMEALVSEVVYELDGNFHIEAEYSASDYDSYSGDGCCVDSYSIDEYENQIDFDRHPELMTLHTSGDLDDVLDDVNCDVYVSRSHVREKNEETGNYENTGRETYDPHGSDYPSIMGYHRPGGCWHYVIPMDRMKLAVANGIIAIARKADTKGESE